MRLLLLSFSFLSAFWVTFPTPFELLIGFLPEGRGNDNKGAGPSTAYFEQGGLTSLFPLSLPLLPLAHCLNGEIIPGQVGCCQGARLESPHAMPVPDSLSSPFLPLLKRCAVRGVEKMMQNLLCSMISCASD